MTLLLWLLLSVPVWQNETVARSGDVLVITWEYAEEDAAQLTAWNLYRATGVSAIPTKIATGGPATREFQLEMPAGSTRQYRFTVRPVKGSLIGPGEEVLVTRE